MRSRRVWSRRRLRRRVYFTEKRSWEDSKGHAASSMTNIHEKHKQNMQNDRRKTWSGYGWLWLLWLLWLWIPIAHKVSSTNISNDRHEIDTTWTVYRHYPD